MPEDRTTPYEMALTHFIVSDDVQRSCRFYTEVLGGTLIRSGEPSYVALANSWIIINVGGGPTDDKPSVTLETPPDPDRTSSFMNIRVQIFSPSTRVDRLRCRVPYATEAAPNRTARYIRDPDGHLIEVGQTTLPGGWRQFLIQP
jgi:catechol 2,3-dioxygenase-like lactoylglutathione lyase family enzyme